MTAKHTAEIQKKVLILGGKAIGSVDIVVYLKQKGYYVIVTDYLPKNESPAKQYADENLDISTSNVGELADYVRRNSICGVFTGVHDFNLQKCREICEETGLPFYASKENFEIASNKRAYKNIFRQFGISVISEYNFSADSVPGNLSFPILLKPVDGAGAYGVQLCFSYEELREKLNKTLSFSEKKEFIAEAYITDKKEITAVYIIKDGLPYLASVANRVVRLFDDATIPLPVAYEWNSEYLGLYEQTVDEKMKKALRHMGFKNGMVFIQCIVKDSVIMPYDLGFRLSGTQEHIIIEAVCGYNPLKLMADYAVTGGMGDENLPAKINPHFPYPAGQVTFLVRPGTVGSFEGLGKVERMDGIVRIVKNKYEGEVVPQSAWGTLNQIALRVFFTADSLEDRQQKMQDIRNAVTILSPEGENILI